MGAFLSVCERETRAPNVVLWGPDSGAMVIRVSAGGPQETSGYPIGERSDQGSHISSVSMPQLPNFAQTLKESESESPSRVRLYDLWTLQPTRLLCP